MALRIHILHSKDGERLCVEPYICIQGDPLKGIYRDDYNERFRKVEDGEKLPPATLIFEKKGSTMSFAGWIPWTLDDVKDDMISFTPKLINAARVWPGLYDDKPVIRMDVNDIKWDLIVGEVNRAPKMIFHAYENLLDNHIQAELFKWTGPKHEKHGQFFWTPAWYPGRWIYKPEAKTFGIDANGNSITPDHVQMPDGMVLKNKENKDGESANGN